MDFLMQIVSTEQEKSQVHTYLQHESTLSMSRGFASEITKSSRINLRRSPAAVVTGWLFLLDLWDVVSVPHSAGSALSLADPAPAGETGHVPAPYLQDERCSLCNGSLQITTSDLPGFPQVIVLNSECPSNLHRFPPRSGSQDELQCSFPAWPGVVLPGWVEPCLFFSEETERRPQGTGVTVRVPGLEAGGCGGRLLPGALVVAGGVILNQ